MAWFWWPFFCLFVAVELSAVTEDNRVLKQRIQTLESELKKWAQHLFSASLSLILNEQTSSFCWIFVSLILFIFYFLQISEGKQPLVLRPVSVTGHLPWDRKPKQIFKWKNHATTGLLRSRAWILVFLLYVCYLVMCQFSTDSTSLALTSVLFLCYRRRCKARSRGR